MTSHLAPLVIKDPPARSLRTHFDWSIIMVRLRDEAPGQWVLAMHDVALSTPGTLKRTYNVEARLDGVDTKTGRARDIYIYWTEHSITTEKMKRAERRLKLVDEYRAKLKAKAKAEAEAQTPEAQSPEAQTQTPEA